MRADGWGTLGWAALTAALLGVGAVAFWLMADPFDGRGVRVTGEIAGVRPLPIPARGADGSVDSETINRPVVLFTTADGRSVEASTHVDCTQNNELPPGTSVSVVYDEADPGRVCLATSMRTFRLVSTGFALAAPLAAAAVLFFGRANFRN
ncbi:DUF3592 domain-containing protein [Streptomyces spiramyceticus]|uniref:DUF3592 domain-containing protein n=1 Tax=Streptomyces spiramyceticus TaxID=299717 RepID=UPI00237AFF46|nr:DUF3592 domain-containing protein [Streptomyces spiramyceticus]